MKKTILLALLFCLMPFLGRAQNPGPAMQGDEVLFGPGPVSVELPSHLQLNGIHPTTRDGSAVWAHGMYVPTGDQHSGIYYEIHEDGSVTMERIYIGHYYSSAEYYKPHPATSLDESFPVWSYADDHLQGFNRLGFEDGVVNNTLSPVLVSMNELSYDYGHNAPGMQGRMLGLKYGRIYLVNMNWATPLAGEGTLLYDPEEHDGIRPVAMACDLDGTLYFVSLSEDGESPSKLYRFDAEDAGLEEPIEVGDLGWPAQHLQTMSFDHREGRLYWWQCDRDGNTNLVEIDPETAETTLVAATSTTEMAGLFFEFEYRPYIVYCMEGEYGTVLLKDAGNQYTLSEGEYLPRRTVEFRAESDALHEVSRVVALSHATGEELFSIGASELYEGSGSFAMPACDIDLAAEFSGNAHGIAYEWTPTDVDGLEIGGPSEGNYDEWVTVDYLTDFDGYLLTGLAAQSGGADVPLRKLTPNRDGKRRFRMPDGEVTVTGTYEAMELDQLEDVCQWQAPGRVPSYGVPEGVTKAELKVRKPGTDAWVVLSEEDWTDGSVFDAAGTWLYRVELTNVYGTFTKELGFEVYEAPVTLAIEGEGLVCEDGEIVLVAVPTPADTDMGGGTFRWYRDGEEIAGATGAQLTVSPAAMADAGNYTVSYSNGDGLCQFVSEPFEVTVPALPEVAWVQPEDGDNAVLITESLELEATPEGGSFSYKDPETGEDVAITGSTFTFPGAGEFGLTYRYEDGYGCANEASVNVTVVQHHFVCYQEKDNYDFPENYTIDGVQQHTVDGNAVLYGLAGDVMTLNIDVPECHHLTSMDINALDGSGSVFTIYNATEPINPYTFTMPAESFFAGPYYVTVDAGWAPNEYSITPSSSGPGLTCPDTGICGEDVTVGYQNVEDYILCGIAVEGACESEMETAVTLPDQITFTMPDCEVAVTAHYESISLGQLDDVCEGQAPGVPGFAISSEYYTGYTYKVQKPGSNGWVEFTEEDWNNGDLFDAAGSWKYRVELTNGYGTFASAEMNFEVYYVPESLTLTCNAEICEGGTILFNAVLETAEAIDGEFKWYMDDGQIMLPPETQQLSFGNCPASNSGSHWTVVYTTAEGCEIASEPVEIIVHPLPEVAWVQPEDGDTVAMSTGSIELQATPEGGTFRYRNSAGTNNGWQEITGNTFAFPHAGVFELMYSYEDENGCSNVSEVRTVNVGSEVHLTDGTGGTLSLSGTQTVFMPGNPVVVSGTPGDCMHIASITVYKTGDYSVTVTSSFEESSGECTFEMPEYDVDVVAGWAVNEPSIICKSTLPDVANFSISGSGQCGSEMTISYDNVEGYVLTSLIVKAGGTDVPVTPGADNTATFTMPDSDVTVTGFYQAIELGDLPNICLGASPGAPAFDIPNSWTLDFENGLPEDWTIVDANNDGWTWCLTSDVSSTWQGFYEGMSLDWYHNGTNAISSGSYINWVGALNPDEYLITPVVVPTAGSTFSFWADAIDAAYPADHFGVAVSTTTPDPSEFTMLQEWTMTAKNGGTNGGRTLRDGHGTWYNYSVDLSDYAGQSIYIAIRHFNCSDQYILCVDDISFGNNRFDKNDELNYEYQVHLDEWMTLDDWDENTTFDEAGEWSYRVAITNEYGTFYSETKTFKVYEAPESIAIQGDQEYWAGNSIVLNAVPTPSTFSFNGIFKWFKDGTEITKTLEPVLTINNCEMSDEGDYVVVYQPSGSDQNIGSITYDFEDSSMQGWTTIDADGDGRTWDLGYNVFYTTGYGHNGSADLVVSKSYDNNYGALTPDNYFVSPQIALGGTISFYACAQDASWASEHFGVAVSTSGNTSASDFTTIQEWTMTAKRVGAPADAIHSGNRVQGNWYQYTVDMSAYNGQIGYVAIRHFNCTDMFYLDVDDIVLAASIISQSDCEITSEAFHVNVMGLSKDVCDVAKLEGFTANEELQVDLYPNPTSGDAKIVSDHAVIRWVTVYNLMGQAILDEEVNNTETMLRLKDVALGVYLVKIITEKGYLIKKMVVE